MKVSVQWSAVISLLVAIAVAVGVACDGSSVAPGPTAAGSEPVAAAAAPPPPAELDRKDFERILGGPVDNDGPGHLRVTRVRTDVTVRVDGAPSVAGLTSSVQFQASSEGATVDGEFAVFADEVDAVMDAALAHDLQILTVEHQFMFDQPRLYALHVSGAGKATIMASGVQSMWAAIEGVRRQRAEPAEQFPGVPPSAGTLDAQALSAVVAASAQTLDGAVKFSLTAAEGDVAAAANGGSSWALFAGDELAASMTGQLVLTNEEALPVLKALRSRGVHVVALHLTAGSSSPRRKVRFSAKGPALQLALALRIALEAQRSASAAPSAAEASKRVP